MKRYFPAIFSIITVAIFILKIAAADLHFICTDHVQKLRTEQHDNDTPEFSEDCRICHLISIKDDRPEPYISCLYAPEVSSPDSIAVFSGCYTEEKNISTPRAPPALA